MERLKELLNIEKFRNLDEIQIKKEFESIVKELMCNYCIRKGKKIYEFAEIEFYLYCKGHLDIITYPRNARLGDWFFHQSGVDICFETNPHRNVEKMIPINEDDVFGGILIRSLYRIDTIEHRGEYINGPLRCCYDLFDQFSAFEPNTLKDFEYPYIDKKNGEQYCDGIKLDLEGDILPIYRYFNFSSDENKRSELNSKFSIKDLDETEFRKYKEASYRFYRDNKLNKIARIKN